MANEVQGAIKINVNGSWLPITTLVGERGPTGSTIDVAVGNVVESSTPSVTVTKQQNTAYFNFGLKTGPTGETGSYRMIDGISNVNQSIQVVNVNSGTQQLVFQVPSIVGVWVADWQVLVNVESSATKCNVGRASLANFSSCPVYCNGYDALNDITPGQMVLFSFSKFTTSPTPGYIMSRVGGFRNVNS